MRKIFIVLLAVAFTLGSCDKTDVKPVKAGFEVSGLSNLVVGETITVHNTSVNGTTFWWSCGTAYLTSFDQNEDFTFTLYEPGSYTLSLKATNTAGEDTHSETITVMDKTTIIINARRSTGEIQKGATVRVYESYDDWYAVTNVKFTGNTDNDGNFKIEEGLKTQKYWFDVLYMISDTEAWINWGDNSTESNYTVTVSSENKIFTANTILYYETAKKKK